MTTQSVTLDRTDGGTGTLTPEGLLAWEKIVAGLSGVTAADPHNPHVQHSACATRPADQFGTPQVVDAALKPATERSPPAAGYDPITVTDRRAVLQAELENATAAAKQHYALADYHENRADENGPMVPEGHEGYHDAQAGHHGSVADSHEDRAKLAAAQLSALPPPDPCGLHTGSCAVCGSSAACGCVHGLG